MRLSLSVIRTSGETCSRAGLSSTTIAEYAQALQEGCVFPPIVVFREESGLYWLADGFHRLEAARCLGFREIEVDLKLGTLRDAILYAVGCNAEHGLRRSLADKRHVVSMLLSDLEWRQWSDREIARLTKTTHPFVAKIRKNLSGNISSERLYQNKYGDLAYMETENIGKSGSFLEKPKTLRLQPAVWKRLEEYQQQWGEASLEEALAKLLDIPSPNKPLESVLPITRVPRTLGIKPALGTLRWAVLEEVDNDYDLPRFKDHGTISTTPKSPTSVRLSELEQDIVMLLREFCPTKVAIEIPFLNTDSETNPKHLQNAFLVIGVLELVCYRECSIVPVRMRRNQWKSHVCDFRARDEDITDTVASLFNLQVKPNERLDAIAIAYAAICGVGEN